MLRGSEGVARAVELLHQGECVALPTETVYGLAADASDDDAVGKIFAAKGRPTNHPLIVHIPSAEHLDHWATDISSSARLLAEACWPGPLTLLLRKSASTSYAVTGGLDTIGLRVPAHPLFSAVLVAFGSGLAAPSANRYKALSPTSAEQVVDCLDGRIAAVLDGGPCEYGLESTIVDLTGEVPRIVRAGPLSRQQVQAVLGCPVEMPEEHDVIVPGNVRAHYQPRTPLIMASLEEMTGESLPANAGYMIYSAQARARLLALGLAPDEILQLPTDPVGYGKQLYASLHALDQLERDVLVVEQPPTEENWAAVNDRLRRAVG